MLIQSHLYVANKMAKKLNVEINTPYFLLGNIIPDFLPQHKKKEHIFKSSLPYVLYEINSIKLATDKNLRSYKLGIVCHYLADFFCKAHNCEAMQTGLWEHFKYESLLHSVLISTNFEIPLKNDIYNVKTFLKKKHEKYLLEEPSVVVDIGYSLEVCQNIIHYIFPTKDQHLEKVA